MLQEKVFVLVTRVSKRGSCDLGADESYAGYLVDAEGNYVISPRVGSPLIVGSDEKSTEALYSLTTEDITDILLEIDGWTILTKKSAYKIKSQRNLH